MFWRLLSEDPEFIPVIRNRLVIQPPDVVLQIICRIQNLLNKIKNNAEDKHPPKLIISLRQSLQ